MSLYFLDYARIAFASSPSSANTSAGKDSMRSSIDFPAFRLVAVHESVYGRADRRQPRQLSGVKMG
jgi:hypothetical protein